MNNGLPDINGKLLNVKQDSFHYIPLLSTLKALLKDTGVLEQVLPSSSRVE